MRWKNSKLRWMLLAVLMAGIVMAVQGAWAQAPDAPAAGAAAATEPDQTLMSVILGNIDFVFVTIIILSVISLTLIISSLLRVRKSVFMPDETINTIRSMIEQKQFKELVEYTETDNSFVGKAINPALKRAPTFSLMKEAMETSIGEQSAEQFRKIEYLNIIGNLGPLLGLLGTVLGMIEAFVGMHNAHGDANPANLAGGISRALAHTFMGLFLAVPSLAAFGVLRTIVDRLTVRGALVADELLMMMRPEGNKTPVGTGAPPVAPGTKSAPPAAPRRVMPAPQPPAQG